MQKNAVNNSREHLLRCLAKELLRKPLHKRRDFVEKHEKKNGEESVKQLKQYLEEESKILVNNRIKARQEIDQMFKK